MDTDSFIVQEETEDIYEVTTKNFEKRLDTLNYASKMKKTKNTINLMKDDFDRKIIKKSRIVESRIKTYT